ncbi:hypothetical protein [Actinomyces radicidentis]|uniref:hypothetical protein n=1 Tax=Actinomyces radicidentis TaxID=111015 RepID=UPI0028E255C7|nr:hypothetical protein [Actinomyces radicidentis]
MTALTDHYRLSGPVPFVDVDTHDDTRLFLDPAKLRLTGPSDVQASAIRCLDSFLAAVTHAVIARDPAGSALLKRFHEPSETHLGMSRAGARGKGTADEMGQRLWSLMTTDLDALFRIGVIRRLEDLPAHMSGIADDLTSDIATRIIFAPLADFTTQMIAAYPELGATTSTVERLVWDPSGAAWRQQSMTLPTADGQPLLLVPHDWVRSTLMSSTRRYHWNAVLSYAQELQATVSDDGKIIKPRKQALKKLAPYALSTETNRRVTLEAHDAGRDLMTEFRAYIATFERAKRLERP